MSESDKNLTDRTHEEEMVIGIAAHVPPSFSSIVPNPDLATWSLVRPVQLSESISIRDDLLGVWPGNIGIWRHIAKQVLAPPSAAPCLLNISVSIIGAVNILGWFLLHKLSSHHEVDTAGNETLDLTSLRSNIVINTLKIMISLKWHEECWDYARESWTSSSSSGYSHPHHAWIDVVTSDKLIWIDQSVRGVEMYHCHQKRLSVSLFSQNCDVSQNLNISPILHDCRGQAGVRFIKCRGE